MINLLPTHIKDDRKYARGNRKLVMWLVVCMFGIGALASIAGGGYLLLQQSIRTEENANKNLAADLTAQNVDTQIIEFREFSNDLSTVTGILDSQYIFSNLVRRIGGTVPPAAVLSGIALTGEDLTLNLSFSTTTNDVANQVLVNLNDAENGLFEQADTLSITCTAQDPNTPVTYPCSTSIKVLFSEDSDFVLLNGLLTEQAVADASTNALLVAKPGSRFYTEQVRIDGIKNTFNLSILSDSAQSSTSLQDDINTTFVYSTDVNGQSVEQSALYFSNVVATGQSCPSGGIADPKNKSDPSKNYKCQTLLKITFNLDPSPEEQARAAKDKDGIASLQAMYIKEFRTNL